MTATASNRGDTRQLLTGWGRTAPSLATVVRPQSSAELARVLATRGPRGVIARGMGRSYGDPAQNAGGTVVQTSGLDQMWLDTATGMLTAQAGCSLDAILRRSIPHGYFVPVTPGTRFVSVGGAIAADVHGKNHHRDGSFGVHVGSLDLVLADGTTRTLMPDDPMTRQEFWATVGGMGLTGVMTSATVRMLPIRTSRMRVDTDRFTSLDALMARMTDADADYRYTVAWVDSVTGSADFRSVLTCGDHAEPDDLPDRDQADPLAYDPRTRASAPPWFPGRTLNRWSVGAFNELWFRKAPRRRRDELHSIADFFHPLDMVEQWNRVYGTPGFLQYQFSVPEHGSEMIRTALERLRSAQAPSFLTVLKRFGPANPAPLSFPATGWTLALDLPAAVPGLAGVLDDLDEQVLAAGGRLYLAKDSRMAPAVFRAGYPRFDEWLQTVRRLDPDGVFTSDQFRRLVP